MSRLSSIKHKPFTGSEMCSCWNNCYIEFFIYPTDPQVDCSKNVKIYIKIYMRGAATCFGILQPSSASYCMCFAKAISINNQLKYVVYKISSV
jgi:hypothetical protein